jgi:hypothetical protein
MFPRLLSVGVRLVNEEIVGEDVVAHSGEVELEEAGGFVTAVTDETFVAPTRRGSR